MTPPLSEGLDLEGLIQRVRYRVGNPSAWDRYDEGASALLREVLSVLQKGGGKQEVSPSCTESGGSRAQEPAKSEGLSELEELTGDLHRVGLSLHDLSKQGEDHIWRPCAAALPVIERAVAAIVALSASQERATVVPEAGGGGEGSPDATDLFDALEAGLVEGSPTLSLQGGCIWIDGEVAFDARAVLRQLNGPASALAAALAPFAAIRPSSLYPPDGTEGEGYVVTLKADYGNPADFTGCDLARARAAMRSAADLLLPATPDPSVLTPQASDSCQAHDEPLPPKAEQAGGWEPQGYEGEVLQNGEWVAGATGESLHDVRQETAHYVAVYGQDGPVEVKLWELSRRAVAPPPEPQGGK